MAYRQDEHDTSRYQRRITKHARTGQTGSDKRNDASDGDFKHVGKHVVAGREHLDAAQEGSEGCGHDGVDEGSVCQ